MKAYWPKELKNVAEDPAILEQMRQVWFPVSHIGGHDYESFHRRSGVGLGHRSFKTYYYDSSLNRDMYMQLYNANRKLNNWRFHKVTKKSPTTYSFKWLPEWRFETKLHQEDIRCKIDQYFSRHRDNGVPLNRDGSHECDKDCKGYLPPPSGEMPNEKKKKKRKTK